MSHLIKKNLIQNAGAVGVTKFLLVGHHILLVPFFITAWGAAKYGEWLTLSAIPSLLAFSSLGLGTAASNAFVLRFTQGDHSGAGTAMKTGQALVWIVSLLGMLLGTGLLWGLYQFNVFQSLEVSAVEAITAAWLLILSSMIGFQGELQHGWFRAARVAHRALYCRSTVMAIQLIVMIVILLNGGGFIWIAACELGITVLYVSTLGIWGRRHHERSILKNAKMHWADAKMFFVKGSAFVGIAISGGLQQSGSLIIVRAMLGAEAAALFGAMRTLGNGITQIYVALQAIIFPELQHALASKAKAHAVLLFAGSILFSAITCLLGVTLLAVIGRPLFEVWTAGQLTPPALAWTILLLIIAVNAVRLPSLGVLRAANRPEAYAIVHLAAVVIGLACTYGLIQKFGVAGAFLGFLLTELIVMAFGFVKSFHILKIGPREFVAGMMASVGAVWSMLWIKGRSG